MVKRWMGEVSGERVRESRSTVRPRERRIERIGCGVDKQRKKRIWVRGRLESRMSRRKEGTNL